MRLFSTLFRRAATAALGLGLLALAPTLVASMLGATTEVYIPGVHVLLAPTLGDPIWAVTVVVLFMLGVALLVAAVWPARTTRRVIPLRLPQSPVGGLEVTMSPSALLSLVRYEAFRVPGVNEIQGSIDVGKSGWDLRCLVDSNRDTPVRPLADALDQRLRSGLLLHTGVPIANLSIDVQPTVRRAHTVR